MAAKTVEIYANTFVLGVVSGPIDDIRCGGADCPVEANLLPPRALLEPRSQEQVAELSFCFINWMRAFVRFLRWLLGRNFMGDSEAWTPSVQSFKSDLSVQMLVVITIAKRL
jgi:hypothetical protein